jgi:hypothetical protein
MEITMLDRRRRASWLRSSSTATVALCLPQRQSSPAESAGREDRRKAFFSGRLSACISQCTRVSTKFLAASGINDGAELLCQLSRYDGKSGNESSPDLIQAVIIMSSKWVNRS